VVIADLDHFKAINDILGHLGGDAVLLRGVAGEMNRVLRPYDAMGRYGGEEFLIVLPGCDQAGTVTAAQRMRQSGPRSGDHDSRGQHPWSQSALGRPLLARGRASTRMSSSRMPTRPSTRAKRAGRTRVEVATSSSNYVSSNCAVRTN